MKQDNTIEAFFALVKAGLWEQDVQLAPFKEIDFNQVYRLAEEQSVIGLVAAGLEYVVDIKLPKDIVLRFVGQTLQLEQNNSAMNSFICFLIDKMRGADIYSLLVKGQGIAQCYKRPFWRACGDVDLYLSDGNYEKAKEFLLPLACSVEPEGLYKKHFEMVIDHWIVELHGSMRSGLSSKMDKVIDGAQNEVFHDGNVRSWMNGNTRILLPGVNSDVIFVFTHFIKHFYCEGLGLRQICDWCRLLWTYKDSLNYGLLESRIRKMGLLSEWKAFATLAVDYLGMPSEVMPLYEDKSILKRRARFIISFILDVGNFGLKRDRSYFHKYPFLIRKTISMGRRCSDLIQHARIFPRNSLRFLPGILFNGIRSALTGE